MGIAALGTLVTMRDGEQSPGAAMTKEEKIQGAIDGLVRREAYVMAFNDCFYFVGIALLLSGIAILGFKKVKPGAGGGGGH